MGIIEKLVSETIQNAGVINQETLCNALDYLYGIKLNTRALRNVVKKTNDRFIAGEIDYLIASNSKGMYITRNVNEIKKYNNNKKHLAMSLLYSAYNADKRANEKLNLNFDEYLSELSKGEYAND